jgi:hypothetical protein
MYVSIYKILGKEVKGCRVYDTPVYDTPYTMAINNSYNKNCIIYPYQQYLRFWAKKSGCRVYDTPVYDTSYTMANNNSYNKLS